jgi:DNA-binding NtrC family response regulator
MAKILLIEDDIRLMRLYTRLLQASGYQVIPSATVNAARAMLERFGKIELCLSDIQVGSIDVDILLTELEILQNKFNTPVLLISSYIEKYQAEAEKRGLRYLSKSAASAELLDAIARTMTAHRFAQFGIDSTEDTVRSATQKPMPDEE